MKNLMTHQGSPKVELWRHVEDETRRMRTRRQEDHHYSRACEGNEHRIEAPAWRRMKGANAPPKGSRPLDEKVPSQKQKKVQKTNRAQGGMWITQTLYSVRGGYLLELSGFVLN